MYFRGGEWRTLNGRPGLCKAVSLLVNVRVRGLGPWRIDCTPALSVSQKRPCSCDTRLVALCKCYMPLPLLTQRTLSLLSLAVNRSCFSWTPTAHGKTWSIS